jgi:hypothetical protein
MEDAAQPRPQKMLEELNGLLGMQLRLNGEQLRKLGEDPTDVKEDIRNMVSAHLTVLYASRVISAVQNRFGEALAEKFEISNWQDAAEKISEAAENALQRRRERLVGESGQIKHDIENLMPREVNDTTKLQLLLSLSQGARTDFDQKTHRQVKRVFSRFSYAFLIAQLLEGREAEEVIEEVLSHLEEAEEALRYAWGEREYPVSPRMQHKRSVCCELAGEEVSLNRSQASKVRPGSISQVDGRYALMKSRQLLLKRPLNSGWII